MGTYIVDKRIGSDTYTTTQAQNPATPWKTLGKVNGALPAGTHTVEIVEGSGPYTVTELGNLSQNSFYPQQAAGSIITYNFNGNALQGDVDVNTGAYRWNRSTSPGKEDWYYLTALDGTVPKVPQYNGALVSLPQTKTCELNGYWSASSTNLNNPPYIFPGQGFTLYGHYLSDNWMWGNFDTLSFQTLYVKFAGGIDPTGTGIAIRVNALNGVNSLLRGGYGGSLHIFNDGEFSGGSDSIFESSFCFEVNRSTLRNTDWQAIKLVSTTLLQQYKTRGTIFKNCGHASVAIVTQQNIDIEHCLTVNAHTVIKFQNDSVYTVNYRNNNSLNLLAGAIQKDYNLPVFNEDHNQFHIDPNSTHGSKAIAFSTGTRYWTQTSPTDLPASTSTSLNTSVDPELTADHRLQLTSPCLGTGTKIPGINKDAENNPLFPPYNIGPYGLSAGALGVASVANDGPPRNNITRLTGESHVINPTDTYQFDDTNAWRVVTGWTAGTANDFHDINGVPIPFTGQQAIDAGIGPRFYCGSRGIGGYTVDQDAAANAKIIRALKVPTYLDTLYWADSAEMDWSASNE